jgi:hypothetical protein
MTGRQAAGGMYATIVTATDDGPQTLSTFLTSGGQ